MMTTLECILRVSTLGVKVCFEAEESPAAGDTRWFCDAAAARGTEKKERKRVEVDRRIAEANTLAVVVIFLVRACGSGGFPRFSRKMARVGGASSAGGGAKA